MKIIFIAISILGISYAGSTQSIYRFIGNGKWSDSSNWENRLVPPDILLNGAEIIIDPSLTGVCVQDIPLYFSTSIKLTVASGKNFIIKNELLLGSIKDTFMLTPADLYVLDSISDFDYTLIQVARIGNRTMNVKDNLIENLLTYAKQLSDKKKQIPANLFPAGIPERPGVNVPAHYGYAYRWDTLKDISTRHYANADGADPRHKADSVVGTDCEGFMWNLLKNGGIMMTPVGSINFPKSLNRQLQTNANANVAWLRLDSLGVVTDTNRLRKGDIIVWKERGHIGMISIDPNTNIRYAYNSNGNPKPNTILSQKIGVIPPRLNTPEEEQASNYGSRRGIHPIPYAKAIVWFSTNNVPATIFRFENVNLTTTIPAAINSTSAYAGGSLQYSGVNQVMNRGICWNTTGKPKKGDDQTLHKGAGPTSFTATLTNLVPGQTYKIRAFVTIRNGTQSHDSVTYYGNEVSLPTLSNTNAVLGNYVGTYQWIPPAGPAGPLPVTFQLTNVNGRVTGSMTANNAITIPLTGTLIGSALLLYGNYQSIMINGTVSSNTISGTWTFTTNGSTANFVVTK